MGTGTRDPGCESENRYHNSLYITHMRLYLKGHLIDTYGNNHEIRIRENIDERAEPRTPAGSLAGRELRGAALLQIVGGDKLIIPFC